MKQCPQCRQFFEDDNSFCLNDGMILNTVDANDNTPRVQEMPTVFVPKLQSPPQSNERSAADAKSNRWIFPLLGVLAGAVIVLGFLAFSQRPVTEVENKSENINQTAGNQSLSVQSAENKLPNNQNVLINKEQIEIPPLTADAVRGVISRWERAQDAQNFRAYQSCYGQPFLGVKRKTNGSEERLNYNGWMNDRRKMLKVAVALSISVENLQISLEGDTANVEFDQYYRSVHYSDWGPKVLKVKMFPDGAKIVYEELKASYPLS